MSGHLRRIETPAERAKVEQLYRCYRGLMLHLAYAILRDEQDAEDAVQQVFVNVAEHLGSIGAPDCPKTKNYLAAAAKHRAIDLYRRRSKRLPVGWEEIDRGAVFFGDEHPLQDCIRALPPRYRRVIELRYLQGYSVRELAALMGISLCNASKLEQRAKARLKKLYEAASR